MNMVFPPNAKIPLEGRVKFGIDPTFSRLHLGHLVPLRLVKKLQREGHPVTIVLGTFTAQLGDPSGRDKTRQILPEDKVIHNSHIIEGVLHKLLDPGFVVWRNGDAHNALTLPRFMKLAAQFTVSHMLSRDAFQKRQEENQSIALHELLVPICQGWDSVFLKAEIEIGGQDQLFNFQVARQLQENEGLKPQVSLMTPIIRGTDGRKMSKSLDNCIFLDDPVNELFGKVMSISDEVMKEWIPLLTDGLPICENPMDEKLQLAKDLCRQLHGDTEANLGETAWRQVFQKKEIPNDLPDVPARTLLEAVVLIRQCSRNEARRLIVSGSVDVEGVRIQADTFLNAGDVVKVGKRDFGKVV